MEAVTLVEDLSNKVDDLIEKLDQNEIDELIEQEEEELKQQEEEELKQEEREEIESIRLTLDEIYEINSQMYEINDENKSKESVLMEQNQQIIEDNSIMIEHLQNINGMYYITMVVMGAILIMVLLYNVLKKFFY